MGRLPTGTVVQPPATPFRSGATVAIDLTAFNSSARVDGALVGQSTNLVGSKNESRMGMHDSNHWFMQLSTSFS